MDVVAALSRLPRIARRGLYVLLLGTPIIVGSGASAVADPVFTNRGRFRIPYQLDSEEINRLGATEIQLHVSTDGGRSWKHVDSVPPVEGKFTFDAAGDGEYQFAVRTVDRRGNVHPAGPLTPSLQVTVDTTLPVLEIEVGQEDVGRVHVRWIASDPHLDADSLKLEYRDPSGGDWQVIPIDATPNGQTSWSLSEGGTVEVRGSVRDAAGNETSAQSSADIQKLQEPAAPREERERRQPIADAAPAPEPEAVVAADPLPEITPEIVAFRRTAIDTAGDAPPVKQIPATESIAERPAVSKSPDPRSADSSSLPIPEEPQDSSRRHVSSTNFQIMYALDDVGPSGVGSVDLYLTEDGGRKWFHYGADPDRRSPFQVSVPNDGTYGFSIRVTSGVGLATVPPQPGDEPDLTIVVDRKPPQARLLPVQQSAEETSQQVMIEWNVADDALPAKPIALYYAEQLSGPWQPLGDWQANTGRYAWEIGPNLPPQVYIRLEARDAAGNTTRVESDQPIVIDLARPTARFLKVEIAR